MQKDRTSDRLSEYSHLNRDFHQVIYRASRRDYLVRALDQIWSAFPTMMLSYHAQTTMESQTEYEAQDHEEHGAIIAALKVRDGEEAERLMRQHIEKNCRELVAVLDCSE
jgi:DNA-binding GntR family transcriptional regulator